MHAFGRWAPLLSTEDLTVEEDHLRLPLQFSNMITPEYNFRISIRFEDTGQLSTISGFRDDDS